jgi:hypothetical protein
VATPAVASGSVPAGAVDVVLCDVNPFAGLADAVRRALGHEEIGLGRTVELYCKLRFGRHTFKTDDRLLAAVRNVVDALGGVRFQLHHLLSDSENERTLLIQLDRATRVSAETVAE